MRDPRRSVPRALLLVMAVVTVVYLAIWAVCTGTLPTLAGADNPVADAAARFLGPRGGAVIAFGIFLSVFGINATSALVAPRCLYVLAHDGYLPRILAWVHPTTRTPLVAIVGTAVVTLVIALSGSFIELAVISVVARFAQYIPTCAAVLVFRARRRGEEPAFRVRGGPVVPILAIGLCLWLLAQAEPARLLWGLVGLSSGLLIHVPMRLARRAGRG
jgi:amino acid transporter